jgi:CRP/FNR family transcriptional regulator, dissimilatory nitrate respiration regulator
VLLCLDKTMKIADFLGNVPLFNGLSTRHIEQLASIVAQKSFKKGQIIFSEGEDASGFYIVLVGRVKVAKLAPDGKEQILHILGIQEPFGEVAVFTGERFPANAEAMEETKVLFLPRDAFVDLIRKEPSLSMNMLALLSQRLRRFSALIEGLSLKAVPARLASYLLYLSNQEKGADSLQLDIPKAVLANLLGTIPETLSRILAKMSQERLLEVDGRHIRLVDRTRLEEVAAGVRTLL